MRTHGTLSIKLPSPTKLARLGHFPPASQVGRLAGPVFYTTYLFCVSFLWAYHPVNWPAQQGPAGGTNTQNSKPTVSQEIVYWFLTVAEWGGGEGGIDHICMMYMKTEVSNLLHWFVSLTGWRGGRGGAGFMNYCKDANEGPVRIQYKCLVPIYLFSEMKLCSLLISKTEL